jgi:type I restriction enzyme M protein
VKSNVLFFDTNTDSDNVKTKEIWYYDYRTNINHTPKKNPLKYKNLLEFIELYNPIDLNKRKETWSKENPEGRWRKFSQEEILKRDKTNLDIFWLKNDNILDLENLPDPDVLAKEIIENIEDALESFKSISIRIDK